MTKKTITQKLICLVTVICMLMTISPLSVAAAEEPVIHLMGDSICQEYPESSRWITPGIKGWGQYIGDYINMTVNNQGYAGSSTKTFPNYSNVYDNVKSGDYVMVNFGHNDAIVSDSRGVDIATYKSNLQNIIDTVTEKGATPIIMNSSALYDRTNGLKKTDSVSDYRTAAKEVAEANELVFIDIFAAHHELFETYNWKYDPYSFFVDESTHLTEAGAREIAKAILRGVKSASGLDELSAYIKSDSEIVPSPADISNPESGNYIVYADKIYSDSVVLRWGTPYDTSDIEKYIIYRRTASETGDGEKIGESEISWFSDNTNLTAETEYVYTVYADDVKLGSQKIKTSTTPNQDPYVTLSDPISENGIKFHLNTAETGITDGYTQIATKDGKNGRINTSLVNGNTYPLDDGTEVVCGVNSRASTYIYFAFDASYTGGYTGNATIEIEYFDEGTGTFDVQYVNADGSNTWSSAVTLTDSLTWKTAHINVTKGLTGASWMQGNSFCRIRSSAPGFCIASLAVKPEVTIDAEKTNYITSNVPQLFLAGDSTCENTSWCNPAPRSGWGMMISDGKFDGDTIGRDGEKAKDGTGDYFTVAVKTVNKALGGRTSQQFTEESDRLPAILNEANPGDYLMIQFGHNDDTYKYVDKGSTVEGIENGYVDDSYEYWLKYIVERAQEKGMRPIILNSVLIRTVSGDEHSDQDRIKNYRAAAKIVADDLDVPFIDVAGPQLKLLNDWGTDGSQQFYVYFRGDYMCDNGQLYSNFASLSDTVHLSDKGADEIAKIIIRAIEEHPDLQDLAKRINTASDYSQGSPDAVYPYMGNIEKEDYVDDYTRGFVINADGTVTINGKIYGEGAHTVILAVYDSTKSSLADVQIAKDIDLSSGYGKFSLTNVNRGDVYKLMVLNGFSQLKPAHSALTLSFDGITTTNKANGVVVSWDAVEGATSYDVYREGQLVADNITETTYADKYFSNIEGMLGEEYASVTQAAKTAEPDIDYTYTVVSDNNIMLASAEGRADAANLIAYITFDEGGLADMADVNDDANGIMMLGTSDHLKTVNTGSWALSNRYGTANYTTTADSDGYLMLSTSYGWPVVAHLEGYNKDGAITSAISFGSEGGRYGFYCGLTATGNQAYKYSTDSEGYLLDSSGNRVKDIADAEITADKESATFSRNGTDYTTENIYTVSATNEPYAQITKFRDSDVTQYVFLMNARINAFNAWYLPSFNYGNGRSDISANAIDGVTVVETGEKIKHNGSNTNSFVAQSTTANYINKFYTYMFEANAKFESGHGLYGWLKQPGLTGDSAAASAGGTGYEISDFNLQSWNINFKGRNIPDFMWIHSFAAIRSADYIK